MKLIRFGDGGDERPGVLLPDGARKDCSYHFADWSPAFFRGGGLSELRILVEREGGKLPDIPPTARWAAPIARPGKIVGIGLNFRDHAKESGLPVPDEPPIFLKAPNTVTGPYDEVLIPRGGERTDWEVELGVVLGRDARYLASPEDAAECVAGYCICHDVSERGFQLERGGQWTKGKSCDTFLPLGPYLATVDELADPNCLRMRLAVNGEPMQDGNTRDMVHTPTALIHYISQFMTLEAGDLVSTGTPAGVGFGRNPPQYLRDGDEVELSIQGLGTQRQRFTQS